MDTLALIEKLKAGNQNFVKCKARDTAYHDRVSDLAQNGQHPFAVVVTCSDSRVAPEIIFDCGLGDLFVIRTAGNVIGPFEAGSIEYAADHLGTRLVVVLGHSHCGAVEGAIHAHGPVPGNLDLLLKEVIPSVEKARKMADDQHLSACAEDLNIKHSADILRTNPVLQAIHGLVIVEAKYDVETGNVAFM